MFKAEININNKDYFNCSMFYIRKYISAKEIILLGVLLTAALLFWFTLENILIFYMFLVTVLLIALSALLFVITALAGYKTDYVKRGVTKHILSFNEWGFVVDSFNARGDKTFSERINFKNVDKAAFRKDRIYIYAGVAAPYYILSSAMLEGDYEELKTFLMNNLDRYKFKMKTKVRQFPYYSKKNFDKDMTKKFGKEPDNNGDDLNQF